MKSLSASAYAVIAIVSLLLVPLFTYLWATRASTLCAVLIFVFSTVFVIAVNKCIK